MECRYILWENGNKYNKEKEVSQYRQSILERELGIIFKLYT